MVITDKKCSYGPRICAYNKASDNISFTPGYITFAGWKNSFMLTKMHTNSEIRGLWPRKANGHRTGHSAWMDGCTSQL